MASLCHRRLSRQSISESIFSHLAVISCQQQEGETHPHTSHPPLSTTFSYNSTNLNQFSNDYSPSTPLTRTELITVTPITRLFMMSSMCCTVMMNLTPDDHCVTVCPGIYWQQCERPAGRELSGVECTVFSPGVHCPLYTPLLHQELPGSTPHVGVPGVKYEHVRAAPLTSPHHYCASISEGKHLSRTGKLWRPEVHQYLHKLALIMILMTCFWKWNFKY